MLQVLWPRFGVHNRVCWKKEFKKKKLFSSIRLKTTTKISNLFCNLPFDKMQQICIQYYCTYIKFEKKCLNIFNEIVTISKSFIIVIIFEEIKFKEKPVKWYDSK